FGRRSLQNTTSCFVADRVQLRLNQAANLGRNLSYRRMIEQAPQRQLHVEGLLDCRDELGTHQGVAAEIEKIVVPANASGSQQCGEEAGQPLFDFRLRSLEHLLVQDVL